MATISKLPSSSWRAQVRRKGHYISDSFLRRGDAELWARTIEGKIDRGEPIHAGAASAKTFGDLVDLHRNDLAEVGRKLGRSKAARLTALSLRLRPLKPSELNRERLIAFGRQRELPPVPWTAVKRTWPVSRRPGGTIPSLWSVHEASRSAGSAKATALIRAMIASPG